MTQLTQLTPTKSLLSIVVPCYNEEAVIEETHRELTRVASQLDGLDHEIVFVDDGSRDETPRILERLHAADPHVRVIGLSRNFGHQLAVTAGLEHASGDAVVLIDADLQDPPQVIVEMVDRWRDGYDVAYGERIARDGETRFKLATARAFYRVLNRLADTKIPLDVGDFRLMDRRVIEALRAMPEGDRFVRGLVSWAGFRQVAVPYRRASRFAGETKYPLSRMLRFAVDGIISFSFAPLRAVTGVGALLSLLGLTGVVYAAGLWTLADQRPSSSAALLIGLLLIGGVQLVCLGVVGEYVGRIYGQAKRRPLYLVRDWMGFEPQREFGRERRRSSSANDAGRARRERREDHTARPGERSGRFSRLRTRERVTP